MTSPSTEWICWFVVISQPATPNFPISPIPPISTEPFLTNLDWDNPFSVKYCLEVVILLNPFKSLGFTQGIPFSSEKKKKKKGKGWIYNE